MSSPAFPVYIPSKGRFETRQTMRRLDLMGVPYLVVVEEQELAAYAAVMDRKKLLVLDPEYQRQYDTFDVRGVAKGKGSGPARNFIWDHAVAAGAEWHWIMDDNIRSFHRLHHNLKVPVGDGTILRVMEEFVLRYSNVAMAGPNYFMFAARKEKVGPFTLNTRIYSCNLIRNDVPFRWRGRYNEDTDLSLRMLKAGWCTVLFNAFLAYKEPTQTIRGGNTDTIYRDGTLPKSMMLAAMHPDVSEVVWKFKRWHHSVDYRPFENNRLRRRPGTAVPSGIDDRGMRLINVPASPVRRDRTG